MKLQLVSSTAFALAATSASAKILNDGTKFAYGKAFDNKVQWQMAGSYPPHHHLLRSRSSNPSPGVLESPCTGDFANIGISDCYQFSLSADGSKNLDTNHLDSPRQRNEFRCPNNAAGETHTYEWKTRIAGDTGTSNNFFHLMQIFDQEQGGPMLTLTARKGRVGVESASLCGDGCASTEWDNYTDRTVQHTMKWVLPMEGDVLH